MNQITFRYVVGSVVSVLLVTAWLGRYDVTVAQYGSSNATVVVRLDRWKGVVEWALPGPRGKEWRAIGELPELAE